MRSVYAVAAMSFVLVLPCSAQVPVHSSISYDPGNPANPVVLAWEAIPGKGYNVLTTTALGQQPWRVLNPVPLYASNNLVQFQGQKDQASRFYRVVRIDTDPPEVGRLSPANGAIAVSRQSPIRVFLRDETAIDPASIVLTVGGNPPVTLADARLTFTNDVLTYTPAAEGLGSYAQTVSASVAVADTQGNRGTNSWSFQLELEPILAPNAVLVSGPLASPAKAAAASGLTLVSTNGNTYVFSYTGSSPGLSSGQVLVSTDITDPYKRHVYAVADDPAHHLVSVTTGPASLAECLQQGSLRLVGDFSALPGGTGPAIPLAGNVLGGGSPGQVEILSGEITFTPEFTVAATFNARRLNAFDVEVAGTLGLDMLLEGRFPSPGDLIASQSLATSSPRLRLLGFVGDVPTWVEAVVDFSIGCDAHVEVPGSITTGMEFWQTLVFGGRLRSSQWTHYEQQTSGSVPLGSEWETGRAGRLRGSVQPRLTIYLEGLAGPTASVNCSLEAEGNVCTEPGQPGVVDLSLYGGFDNTLGIALAGWDHAWAFLPSWTLFNLRSLALRQDLPAPSVPPVVVLSNLVWIPCGSFLMGSPTNELLRYPEEGPQTHVTLTRGFWMGRYEVTQGEYLALRGTNPSAFTGNLSCPVEQVDWSNAVAYGAALTERERQAGRVPEGYEYRLPTEAEWEHACRAGTTTPFHYGTALRSGMANFYGLEEYDLSVGNIENRTNGIALFRTAPVGSYAPNAWGLYDMHGNVWEWCLDNYGPYPGGNVSDPRGSSTGLNRRIRGGSWVQPASHCRSAYRGLDYAETANRYTGFRVVLGPVLP